MCYIPIYVRSIKLIHVRSFICVTYPSHQTHSYVLHTLHTCSIFQYAHVYTGLCHPVHTLHTRLIHTCHIHFARSHVLIHTRAFICVTYTSHQTHSYVLHTHTCQIRLTHSYVLMSIRAITKPPVYGLNYSFFKDYLYWAVCMQEEARHTAHSNKSHHTLHWTTPYS